MQNYQDLRIGTAGWGIPSAHAALFPEGPAHLSRYAEVLNCAEINTSFYRPHRPATYQRWAESTPDDFRFSIKAPRWLSHESALKPDRERLKTFLGEIRHLGDKLGPVLVQLPPRQAFEPGIAESFLATLRELYPAGPIVIEPRHKDWFLPEVDSLMRSFRVSRVIADPAPVPRAVETGGDPDLMYYRLHGSPRTYYSSYAMDQLTEVGGQIESARASVVWCIFDNTAAGEAAPNALTLRHLLSQP